ncbi:MAG: 50S ribosomal protein L25/general stress protein Ctc [Pseudomonadota bacterium]|nr:50S ribosomal protein L25/general stress protein Ctc [Pseudomonadota bacterium]
MSDIIELTAELRTTVGKGASRRLRRLEGKVPAIIYGGEGEAVMLSLSSNELSKAMQVEAFYSQVLNVSIDGKSEQAVVRDLQRNPADERVQHVDFQRVRADVAITVSVPLHFINEESCVGVKMQGGTLTRTLTEVEVSCLPANLPEYIEVDMAEVESGTSVHLSDLNIGEDVTIIALTLGEDRNIPVASVTAKRGGVAGDGEEVSANEETPAAEDAADDASEG